MPGSRKTPVRPPRLKPLAHIALVAPSGPLLERDDLVRAEELARALGWRPSLGPHSGEAHGYLAGTDDQRVADLNATFTDPDADGIWCIRGGYGLTRILDRLDYEALARHPKVIVGYSDITALLLAIHARTGLITFHGPVARNGLTGFSRRHLERMIAGTDGDGVPALDLPDPTAGTTVPRTPRVVSVQGGTAEGPLIGGNLTLVHCLTGTPYLPSLDGAILFLEDVGEALYAIDRMFSHLRLAGLLDRLAGVAIGHFTDMKRNAGDGALGLDRVLDTYFAPLGIPVVHGLPIGHLDDQWTLPIGIRARLDADAGALRMLEPGVG